MTWPMRGARVVPVAARSTPAGISAGPEACRPGSTTRRIVGGSASAARWMGAASRHAAVAAVSGAPGVPCHHGGADLGDAARRNTPASGAPVAAYGVSQRTIARGREWRRAAFAESRFWQAKRAVLMPPIDQARLPASLLARFAGSGAEQFLPLFTFSGADQRRGHRPRLVTVFADPTKTHLVGSKASHSLDQERRVWRGKQTSSRVRERWAQLRFYAACGPTRRDCPARFIQLPLRGAEAQNRPPAVAPPVRSQRPREKTFPGSVRRG
jgi:hypothetical protein